MRFQEGWIALAFVAILGAIIIPLPAFLLDVLLALSITFAVSSLMLTFFVKTPLELSSFPSLLLLGTLLRLSLNIAAARRILLYGDQGTDAAGHIIESFGEFVVGGDVLVGIIVFLIFIVINFIVITRGAERISEVSARFTLDAMPGKQMSIDADLNAGIITEAEAKRRREQLEREAAFYGSMDGASKFIRGDAIAALLILFLSLIGGLIIGIVFKGMDIGEAFKTYTLLTVGEGLASQIPALILYTSAGIVMTKTASKDELGNVIAKEFSKEPKALIFASGLLFFIGLIPGFPKIPFFFMAGILGGAYFMLVRSIKEEQVKELEKAIQEQKKVEEEREEEIVPQPDPITMEVGYGLIPLIDESQGGDIPSRIRTVRKQIANEYGLIIPLVHIRDNLKLSPYQYRILIKGIDVDSYEIVPNHLLAVDLGNVRGKIEGKETYEPAFKMKAYWITEEQKDQAQNLGYMVVDISTLIITHISEVIKRNLHEILGRNEVVELIDALSKKYPKVVQEIVPEQVPISVIHRVLQNLLREGIPINDLMTILETLADYIEQTKDPEVLTEYVRQQLAKRITRMYMKDGTVYAVALSPRLESKLQGLIMEQKEDEFLDIVINRIYPKLNQEIKKFLNYQVTPLLVTSSNLRRYIRKTLEAYLPELSVISYNELERKVNIKIIGIIDED